MSDTEFSQLRRRPTQSYTLATQKLIVPAHALAVTLEVLSQCARLETCCFWYGTGDRGAREVRVTAVVVPRQRQTWGNYQVSVEAVREMSERLSPYGLRNLAQVHSHPGDNVEHSSYDDEMANSRKALSLVFPRYGHWNRRWPAGVGVHEFQGGYWHLLGDSDAAKRVSVQQGAQVTLIDCR
jgi:hypothetical protein